MRILKLALATGFALLIASGSAYAITVKKRIEAPGLPPEVWAVAGAFCAIKEWHPAVAKCEETKEGDVTFRTLTLKDGGKIKEKLTGTEDDRLYLRDRREPPAREELQVQAVAREPTTSRIAP